MNTAYLQAMIGLFNAVWDTKNGHWSSKMEIPSLIMTSYAEDNRVLRCISCVWLSYKVQLHAPTHRAVTLFFGSLVPSKGVSYCLWDAVSKPRISCQFVLG